MALHVKMFDSINTIYSITKRPFHLWSAYFVYPNLSWSGCLPLPLSFCFSTDCQSRGATVGCQLGVCTYRWWSGDGLWYHHHIRNYLLSLDVFRWSRRKLGKMLECQSDHVNHHQTPFCLLWRSRFSCYYLGGTTLCNRRTAWQASCHLWNESGDTVLPDVTNALLMWALDTNPRTKVSRCSTTACYRVKSFGLICASG